MAEIGLWSITIPAAAANTAVYTPGAKGVWVALELLVARKALLSELEKLEVEQRKGPKPDAYEWAF